MKIDRKLSPAEHGDLADCWFMCVTETLPKEDLDLLVKEVIR